MAESAGTDIALVYSGASESARELFTRYHLGDIPRFRDPSLDMYKAFGLHRGSWTMLLQPSLWRAAGRARRSGHRQAKVDGDPWQLGGAAMLRDGKVLRVHKNVSAGDRPDYSALLRV